MPSWHFSTSPSAEPSSARLARQIRERDWGKNLVLIALTGRGQEEDRQKSKDAGFNEHLPKPVDLDALGEVLARLLPTAR